MLPQIPGLHSFEIVTGQSKTRLAFDGTLGTLRGWSDDVSQRVNEHLILNRAGAVHQDRGTGPRKFSFTCLIQEPGASDTYQSVEARLGAEPFCTMIHPRLGTIPIVYLGLKVQEDLDATINALTVELSVSETGLRDIKQVSATQASRQGAQAAGQLGALAAAAPSTAILTPLATQVSTTVNQFLSLIDSALITTVSPATGLITDVSAVASQYQLAVALVQVASAVDALVAQVSHDPGSYGLLVQARLSYGYSLAAYQAVAAGSPPIIRHTVKARISLARLCCGLYGGGAAGVEVQVALLNRIDNPYALQAGDVLLIPDPAYVVLPDTAPPVGVPLWS